MTPAKIKYELEKRGITQKQIALDEKRNPMIVSNTIWRKRTSRPMMEAIAQRLGKAPEAVFPDRYKQKRKAA